MKPITQWQADDGSVWPTVEQAQRRDDEIVRCDEVEQRIGLRPRPQRSGCDYENGEGYIQQPKSTSDRLWKELKALGWNRDSDGPIGKLGYRYHCMDDQDREWGQPYFAHHPERAKVEALAAHSEPAGKE